MVDTVRYANPLSPGGDGTSKVLSGGTAPFVSLNAAINGLVQNITSLGSGNHLVVQNFGIAEDTTVISIPAGYVSNATNQLIIEKATGEAGGDGDMLLWDSGAWRFNPTTTSGTSLITNGGDIRNLDYIKFRNLHLGGVFNGTVNQSFWNMSQSPWGATVVFENCVFRFSGGCTGALLALMSMQTTVNVYFTNCTVIVESYTGTAALRGVSCATASAVLRMHNCTLTDLAEAIYQTAGTASIGNVIIVNSTTPVTGTVSSKGGNRTNAANLGSLATTTNDAANQTFTFQSGTYKLDSTDVGARDQGVDLTSDPDLPVTTDAIGTARPFNALFDAGAHEYDGADTAPPTYDVAPSFDSSTTTQITCSATASDAVSATVNHYAVLVADGDPAPSAAQVKAGQNSASAAALDADSVLAVTSGVSAQIILDAPTPYLDYDEYWTAEDETGNLSAPVQLDVTTDRVALPQSSSVTFEQTITVDLSNFSGAPTGAQLINATDTIDLAISNASSSAVDVTMSDESEFVSAGNHQRTRFNTNYTLRITEAGGSADYTTFQITPPDTDGPDEWFGVLAGVAPDAPLVAGSEVGFEYYIERITGTGVDVNDFGSSAADTDWSVRGRYFNTTTNVWSATRTRSFAINDITNPIPVLTGPVGTQTGQFDVDVDTGEATTDLISGDFTVANGTIANFTGSGLAYTLTIDPTPDTTDNVLIDLLAGRYTDAQGNPNNAASQLSVPFNTFVADTTPNPFIFIDQINVAVSTLITSAPITVAGINSPAAISVSGGEYSIDGGAFTAAPGVVNNGEQVRARHTSSGASLTAVNTIVDIGGVQDIFTSTTIASGAVSATNPFDLGGAVTNADPGSVHKAIPVELSGFPSGDLSISVSNGVYSIDGGAQTSAPGTVQNGQLVEFWVTAAATPFTPVVGNLSIDDYDADFIVVTGDQTQVNEGVVFTVRDRDTNALVVNTTIDVMVTTEQFGGAPLYQAAGFAIDGSGRLIVPLAGGELGRQVFVSGLLADGRYIAGNALIVDITGL